MKFFWSIMNAEHSNLVHPIAPSCDKSWWSSAGWCICTNINKQQQKYQLWRCQLCLLPFVFTESKFTKMKIKFKIFYWNKLVQKLSIFVIFYPQCKSGRKWTAQRTESGRSVQKWSNFSQTGQSFGLNQTNCKSRRSKSFRRVQKCLDGQSWSVKVDA